jgi:hypothetical protein
MTKQEEYVQNAVESLELAERLASSSDRRRMLKLAEAWGLPTELTTADVTPRRTFTTMPWRKPS